MLVSKKTNSTRNKWVSKHIQEEKLLTKVRKSLASSRRWPPIWAHDAICTSERWFSFKLTPENTMAYKIPDTKAATKDRCRSMPTWHISNAASWCVPKYSSWKPKIGNPTCSLVPAPLPQRWGPAASPVLWLWSWDLLHAKASCQKPALPQSTAGAGKSAGEGLGADAEAKLNPDQINKSIVRFDHSVPVQQLSKGLVLDLFKN